MVFEIIIGVVVAAFLIAAIIMEFRNKNKKGDLFTNIVISVIGLGCSGYMLFSIYKGSLVEGHFDSKVFFGEFATWIYFVVILLTIAFSVIYLMFYFKNKDLVEQEEEETLEDETDEEDEELTDEEIEEILEKENAETEEENNQEEDNTNSEEVDEIVLESLTAQKPKVLKANEEDFMFKEGATQVPTNQRNPFEKNNHDC